MKVILADDVRGLGHRGETVTVKPGYARNYLFPQGLAYEANAGNVRKLGEEKKKYDEKMLHEKARARSTKKRGEEGAPSAGRTPPAETADALAEKGIEVDRRRIELAEPIKRLGEHRVHVRLHRDVTTELIVAVNPLAPVTA